MFNEMELDALREVGNIGAGHAATSLSQLLNRTIEISVPGVNIVEIPNVLKALNRKPDEIITSVVTALNEVDKVVGFLFFIFPNNVDKKIAEIMMVEEEMLDSALAEIGNILASSFCNALAEFLNIVLMPTPPNLVKDYILSVLDELLAQIATKSNYIIIFETQLKDENNMVTLDLILVPSETLINYIRKAISMV
ncbi:MAG TPA: chemotaxis protein CheC [Archaeoglobus profundus]|nr:chemotaxis protein CheC [Archaeoglobus profundus]